MDGDRSVRDPRSRLWNRKEIKFIKETTLVEIVVFLCDLYIIKCTLPIFRLITVLQTCVQNSPTYYVEVAVEFSTVSVVSLCLEFTAVLCSFHSISPTDSQIPLFHLSFHPGDYLVSEVQALVAAYSSDSVASHQYIQ